MRVFVAGATGVIGQSLVPRLIEKGHALTAMTRSQERADRLAELGAKAVVCDVYDQTGVQEALRQAQPDMVVHQLTALPTAIHPRRIAEQLAENDRIRVEGTRNLVRAAVKVGVHRIVAQSIAFAYAPLGGPVKDEEAPLWSEAPWPWNRTVTAVDDLEPLDSTGRCLAAALVLCSSASHQRSHPPCSRRIPRTDCSPAATEPSAAYAVPRP